MEEKMLHFISARLARGRVLRKLSWSKKLKKVCLFRVKSLVWCLRERSTRWHLDRCRVKILDIMDVTVTTAQARSG